MPEHRGPGRGRAAAAAAAAIGLFLGAVSAALAAPCAPSDTVLCIDDQSGDRRFQVQVAFQTSQGAGAAGPGHAIPLSSVGSTHSGLVWFFSADNPELLIKILPGCSTNGFHWVFASAGTNVGVTITVTDTLTAAQKVYSNPDNHPMDPIQDNLAFACP